MKYSYFIFIYFFNYWVCF